MEKSKGISDEVFKDVVLKKLDIQSQTLQLIHKTNALILETLLMSKATGLTDKQREEISQMLQNVHKLGGNGKTQK